MQEKTIRRIGGATIAVLLAALIAETTQISRLDTTLAQIQRDRPAEVLIGNPKIPSCTANIPTSVFKDMNRIEIYRWATVCEDLYRKDHPRKS